MACPFFFALSFLAHVSSERRWAVRTRLTVNTRYEYVPGALKGLRPQANTSPTYLKRRATLVPHPVTITVRLVSRI